MSNFLSGWKTYIVAVGAIVTAIGGYASNSINVQELIAAIFAAIGTMTMRHAISTTPNSNATNNIDNKTV